MARIKDFKIDITGHLDGSKQQGGPFLLPQSGPLINGNSTQRSLLLKKNGGSQEKVRQGLTIERGFLNGEEEKKGRR